MTDKDMGKLTLADLERIAERFSTAVATIREGQALLGGERQDSPPPRPEVAPDDIAAHRLRQLQAPEPAPGGKLKLSAAEQADRSRLLNQFKDDPGLPDEIRAMENGQ